jgi:hypothetical protein
LWLILLLAFIVRTYRLCNPPWDYHNWRQTLTLMVARDFARHGFDVLHPHVNGAGPYNPNYFSGEFSIQSLLAAILYKSFGESDALARLVTIAFSLAGIYFLFHLIERHAGSLAASLAALIYALLPYHIYFGRVFMPDIPAISLALAGVDFLDRWAENPKWTTLLIAAGLTMAAVIQKLTVAFVAVPTLYLFWHAQGKRLWVRRELYIFGGIVSIPSFAWYTHSASLGRESGFYVMQPFTFARHLNLWLTPGFFRHIAEAAAAEMLSPVGAVLAIVGLLVAAAGVFRTFWRLWFIAGCALLFLIPDLLPENHYYLSLMMPPAAALAGMGLARIASFRIGWPVIIVLMTLFAWSSWRSVLPFYAADRAPRDLGLLLNHLSAPNEALIAESGGSPAILYFADRPGWLLDRTYDARLIHSLAQKGGRYYADIFQADVWGHQSYFQTLDKQFHLLTPENAHWISPIYDLRRATSGAPAPKLADVGDQLELQQFTVHKLLDWPAAFEVTCLWTCRKTVTANLRVFIHITNTAGQTTMHWEHSPTHSESGIIRERYVAALPGSLPDGSYQIWLSWLELQNSSHSPVIRSTAPRQDNRVKVAEIRIRVPHPIHWFRGD